MSEKRHCIFTGKPSDFKLNLTSTEDDLHNWAKSIPTTKEYVGQSNLLDRPLKKHEMKLVELFYEQELARLRASNLEAQMAELRLKLEEINSLPTSDQYFAEMAQEIIEENGGIDDSDEAIFPTCREDIVGSSPVLRFDRKIFEEYEKLEKEDEGECPKCDSKLLNAGGIGPFCPNKDCGVKDNLKMYDEPKDGISPETLKAAMEKPLKPTKKLTKEKENVTVKKIVTKKKGLWD